MIMMMILLGTLSKAKKDKDNIMMTVQLIAKENMNFLDLT